MVAGLVGGVQAKPEPISSHGSIRSVPVNHCFIGKTLFHERYIEHELTCIVLRQKDPLSGSPAEAEDRLCGPGSCL